MTGDNRIYDLLPAIHRIRDAEQGYPLRTVLRVIAGQMSQLEASIAQLYDDWFIETCQDWVVPYLGDLVQITLDPAPVAGGRGLPEPLSISRRREVANALTDRRAKGSLQVLERLAADATGWPARAIELGPLLAVTQSTRYPDLSRGRLIDTRDEERLEAISTPFDREATVVDTRTTSASRLRETRSRDAVAVAVWRLVNDDTQHAPALCVNDDNHYTFDVLGRDQQLCVSPVPRAPGACPASDLDVPAPITRLALGRRLEDYYGPHRSLCVYRQSGPVRRTEIVAADLTEWRYRPRPGQVAVDPVLGRIAFPPRHAPEEGVWVRYSRLMVGGIGGGHYPRSLAPLVAGQVVAHPPQPASPAPHRGAPAAPPKVPALAVYRVASTDGGLAGVSDAVRTWQEDNAAGRAGPHAAIEITDDAVYEERLRIELEPGQQLEIRAAEGCRPVLRPVDRQRNRPQSLLIEGHAARPQACPPPSVILDGVWVAGHCVELAGELGTVTVRHCTLVPGRDDAEADRRSGEVQPSMIVRAAPCDLAVDHSIIGRVSVESPETVSDPLPVTVADSVIDGRGPAANAFEGPDGEAAYVVLTLQRVTVLGGAHVHQIGLVEDTILTGPLRTSRRQVGQVRYSYIPDGSATPQRTGCQPDGVLLAARRPGGQRTGRRPGRTALRRASADRSGLRAASQQHRSADQRRRQRRRRDGRLPRSLPGHTDRQPGGTDQGLHPRRR